MAKKEWKQFGKNTGNAFKNFGKAIATTAKVAVGKEENTKDENGKSKLKSAWSNTGKGFGDAGKSLGSATKDTFKSDEKVEEEKAKKEANTKGEKKEEIVDVESKDKE
ncbi:MAG: hypothetical protein K6E11_02810 [Bacilli bacterium]|nr:hypothetical protein [Bacilli bacterium]